MTYKELIKKAAHLGGLTFLQIDEKGFSEYAESFIENSDKDVKDLVFLVEKDGTKIYKIAENVDLTTLFTDHVEISIDELLKSERVDLKEQEEEIFKVLEDRLSIAEYFSKKLQPADQDMVKTILKEFPQYEDIKEYLDPTNQLTRFLYIRAQHDVDCECEVCSNDELLASLIIKILNQ